jgi:hypothetical protein
VHTERPSEAQAGVQTWEYKLVSMGNPLQAEVELRANALGKLGWELAAIDAGVWVFKRPSASEPPSTPLEAVFEETVPLSAASEPLLVTPAPATS